MATLSSIITPTNITTASNTQTLTNKTLTSPTLTAPVLGIPASGTVTNLTGTASININGTVGATTAAAGSFTTVSATGAITPSQTAGVVGTTTNNNANAGAIGEFFTSTLARNASALAVTTAFNIVNISLTAGDWDVNGMVQLSVQSGAEVISTVLGSISTTSLTLNTQATLGYYESRIPITPSGDISFFMGPVRISLASTTTVYLITAVTWAGGAGIKVGGTMAARRAR